MGIVPAPAHNTKGRRSGRPAPDILPGRGLYFARRTSLFSSMSCSVEESVLGKRSREADEEDEYDKKRRIIEDIEASLPPDLSKNQRKKQVKMHFRDMMKSEWRYVLEMIKWLLLTKISFRARKKEKEKVKRRRQKEDTPQELGLHKI